jgi:hypothetical protein
VGKTGAKEKIIISVTSAKKNTPLWVKIYLSVKLKDRQEGSGSFHNYSLF